MPENSVPVQVEMADHVATVTLDRPPVNAFDTASNQALTGAFESLAADSSLRAVVLTGAGKVFCAGADVKSRPELPALAAHNHAVRTMFDAISDCPVPVVAAVNG